MNGIQGRLADRRLPVQARGLLSPCSLSRASHLHPEDLALAGSEQKNRNPSKVCRRLVRPAPLSPFNMQYLLFLLGPFSFKGTRGPYFRLYTLRITSNSARSMP